MFELMHEVIICTWRTVILLRQVLKTKFATKTGRGYKDFKTEIMEQEMLL